MRKLNKMFDLQRVSPILKSWGIRDAVILPDESVPGSPERAVGRAVVKDIQGRRFVLEQLSLAAFEAKTVIASRIDHLHRSNLSVCPYLEVEKGQWIQRHDGYCWQLAPLLQGIALDRYHYWNEGWRGEALANFLADLAEATWHWTPEGENFSLPAYIEDLIERIAKNNPEYLQGIEPVAEFLRKRFYPVVNDIPLSFCHGDPHPLNTIWGEKRILAVIDWEFCGWKPMLYDAALVVGCVGAEDAEAGQAGLITAFLETLKSRRIYSKEEITLLPLFVLAVRFGWLSEWLRRKDKEMIDFEIFYMNHLIELSQNKC